MEGPGLAARLEALLQQLAAGVGTADEAGEIFIQADTLAEGATAWRAADHSQEEAEALRSVVNGAADVLGANLPTLAQQLSRGRGGYAGAADQLCLDAACNAAVACLAVARPCGASSELRLQLAQAGIRCLVSGGRLRLCESQSGAGTPPAVGGTSLRVKLRQQMQLANLCIRGPTQTAETAGKAATPAQLAAWMAAIVHGMKRLGEDRLTAQMQRELLPAFADMCFELLCAPAWAAHADAVAKLPLAADIAGLCLALLSVLAVSLPLPEQRRPAGCTWNSPFQLSRLLSGGGGPLHAGLTAYIRAADSGSISAAVAAAAQLMQHVPLDQPPPGFSREHPNLVLATTSLLANLCVLAGKDFNVCRRLSDQHRRRAAKQVLPAIGRLPQLLQLASGGKQAADLTGDEPVAVFGVVASAHCFMLLLHAFYRCPIVGSQHSQAVLVSGLADATAWCSAASGALQCMPLVQQLHALVQQQAGPAAWLQLPRQHSRTPAVFATAAVEVAQLAAVCALIARQQAGATAAVDSAVHAAAWQLHSRAAQLVHFSAAAADPLVNLGDEVASGRLLCALTECFTTAISLRRYDGGQPEPTSDAALLRTRQLQALCVEHAAALLACNARRPLVQHDPGAVQSTLYGLAAAIADGPLAVGLDPALHALFDQLWSKVARMGQQRREATWRIVLESARHGPFLAALLASGGYLETVVQSAGQDGALLEVVCAALGTLGSADVEFVAATDEAAGDSSNSTSATPADDAAAVERVSRAVEALGRVMPPNSIPSSSQWHDVLAAARRLAAALLDLGRRPSMQQEQQLEAAQAAAARSCAYLRCTNLGGGSGPAAGQGEGSQRCSACRAVWYCGTACSHADWRAGHKRVCKALGAARLAEKAARRQAAEEAEPAGPADAPAA